jgi:hypothetical protein
MTSVLTWGVRCLAGVIAICVTGYIITRYRGSRGWW